MKIVKLMMVVLAWGGGDGGGDDNDGSGGDDVGDYTTMIILDIDKHLSLECHLRVDQHRARLCGLA